MSKLTDDFNNKSKRNRSDFNDAAGAGAIGLKSAQNAGKARTAAFVGPLPGVAQPARIVTPPRPAPEPGKINKVKDVGLRTLDRTRDFFRPTPVATAAPATTPNFLQRAVSTIPGAKAAGSAGSGLSSGAMKTAGGVVKGAGKLLAPVALANDASRVVGTVMDPNASALDVAGQATRQLGKWGGAAVGAEAGALGGAALGALGGPLAPVTVPLGTVLGAVGGGIGGYMGADKLLPGEDRASALDYIMADKPPGRESKMLSALKERAKERTSGAEPAAQLPVQSLAQGLRQASVQNPDTDGAIIGTSTRADGKLNSFSGGSNQINPEDFAAATQRAAVDKSRVASLAAAKMSEGDLDGAYRLAAGDPEATAAVESARQQRGLRIRAANGDRAASDLLQQQSVNEASIAGKRIDAAATENAAATRAGTDMKLGLAKAMSDALKAQNDAAKDKQTQQNTERSFRNAEGKQNQKNIQNALEGVLGPRALKDGVPNPAYADFEAKLNETLLQGAAGADGKPRTMQNLSAAELQDFLRAYQLEKESAPGALGKAVNFLTGNSRPESNDLLLNAPRPGTAQEGVLYDTYKDGQGQVRRVGGLAGRDLTVEERRRVGLPTGLR